MTPFYASLEQLDHKDAHPSFDIWALGIILYTLMAKTEPFKEFNIRKRMEDIEKNKRDELPSSYSLVIRLLVDYLLTLD